VKKWNTIVEEEQDKALWDRYIKALDKSEKIHNTVNKLGIELSRIQKAMKKKAITDLKNPNGDTVFSVNEDTGDRSWSMVRG
jgi:hypothetical protein